MQQHTRPFWLAALISPWIAPVAFCLYLAVMADASAPTATALITTALTRVLPISYAATLLLGLPYVYWLRARAALSVPSVCAGAVVAGLLLVVGYTTTTLGWGASPAPAALRAGVGLGLCLGLAFSIVAGVSLRQHRHID